MTAHVPDFLWRDRLAERSKRFARVLRQLPGLGYSGDPVILRSLVEGETLLEPEGVGHGHWVGAPSVTYDPAGDRLLVHIRHRDPDERGYTASIHEMDQETLQLQERCSISRHTIGARSLEGGTILAEDGELRWFLSYQHEQEGDWRIQQRQGSDLDSLGEGGDDLAIDSPYIHNKDPVVIDGRLYVNSSSRSWLRSRIEAVDIDDGSATEHIPVTDAANARITGGAADTLFLDTWPDLPGTDVPNVLWTGDERATAGRFDEGSITVDSGMQFVSPTGGSVTYPAAERLGEQVYLLWQEETGDGSNVLAGSRISIDAYRRRFDTEK